MKKTIWSLAALMFMAAPMMTSCSKALDEVQTEQAKGNIVTLTIAPPVNEADTRVSIDGTSLKITGWELDDEVILYQAWADDMGSYVSGNGVAFKCSDAANGTFTGTLPTGKTLDEYTLAVFGVTAFQGDDNFFLRPTKQCSAALKDVVEMAAWKSGDGKYSMKVINNVIKINNNTGSAMDVACLAGIYYNNNETVFFTPLFISEGSNPVGVIVTQYNPYTGWNDSHFTLPTGVSYINIGQSSHPYENIGIAKEDGTEIVQRKCIYYSGEGGGKLYNAGTIN